MTDSTETEASDTRRWSRDKSVLAIAGAVLAALAFAGGFAVKAVAAHDDRPHFEQGTVMMMGQPGPDGQGDMRGGPRGPRHHRLVVGKITAIDGDTVTIKTRSGKTVKVKISDSTKIKVTKTAKVSDLKTGDKIVVGGKRDGDTVTAKFVGTGQPFGPPPPRR